MRILFISKPYVARPYRRKLLHLAELAAAGKSTVTKVGLICPTAWGYQQFEAPDKDELSKLWIKALPIRFPGKNHFHFYKDLAAAVSEYKPDLINVEEEDYSVVTWQCMRLAAKLRIPSMFYAWQNIYKNYPPPFVNIEKYVYRHAAGAAGGSDNAGRILRRKGYAGPYVTIPQIGIDMSIFAIDGAVEEAKREAKRKIGIDPDDFVVFYAGRIVEEKGLQTLIDAGAKLKDRIKLLIVGSGPYLETLKAQAARLLPAAMVRFVPFVTASEMPTYTKAADAMCLPSLTRPNWMEQGPVRIITESMSAKCVAIVSDSVELPLVVGDAGLVFREGSADNLADCIERVRTDAPLRVDLRERGYARVKAHYSSEAVASALSTFISEIVTPPLSGQRVDAP